MNLEVSTGGVSIKASQRSSLVGKTAMADWKTSGKNCQTFMVKLANNYGKNNKKRNNKANYSSNRSLPCQFCQGRPPAPH
jgi:hypothetical protein